MLSAFLVAGPWWPHGIASVYVTHLPCGRALVAPWYSVCLCYLPSSGPWWPHGIASVYVICLPCGRALVAPWYSVCLDSGRSRVRSPPSPAVSPVTSWVLHWLSRRVLMSPGQCQDWLARRSRTMAGVVVVCWLLNVPATCECISGTDLLRQVYVLPHRDRSCRSNFPSHPVTVY